MFTVQMKRQLDGALAEVPSDAVQTLRRNGWECTDPMLARRYRRMDAIRGVLRHMREELAADDAAREGMEQRGME